MKTRKLAARRGRKALRRRRLKAELRIAAVDRFTAADRAAPKAYNQQLKREVRTLVPPRAMNLEASYHETIQFLKDIRLCSSMFGGRFMIGLEDLEEISPAAALLLVAECDRWRLHIQGHRLRAISIDDWKPSVRRRLDEMGFFEVLGATNTHSDESVLGEDRYVRFISGTKASGDLARELRLRIEALGPTIADSELLFGGLTEAMTNVRQHAYPDYLRDAEWNRWWISASVNTDQRKLTVMVVDHGEGIAKTLPRSEVFERIRGALAGLGVDLLKDQAKLLEAAFQEDAANKSQTGLSNRGKGLREDIKGVVVTLSSPARLRVLTNRAKYIYQQTAQGDSTKTALLPTPFNGTFIEWVIEDYGHEQSDHN